MTQSDLLAPRLAAVAYPLDDADWADVLRRAHVPAAKRWPLSRRRSLAVAVLLLAAIVFLVAPALGIGPPALDFFAAKHAPKPVALDFERMNVGAPKGMSPGVVAGQTRLVKTYHLRSGRAFPLWVAPTRKGTFCFTFGGGGGCAGRHVPTSHERGDFNSGAIGLGIEGLFHTTVLDGYVYDQRIADLEVRVKHAPPITVPLLWVSRPIDAGFFYYDLTEAQRRHHSVVAVVALDAHGKVLARVGSIFRSRPAWFDWRKVAELSKRHVILRSGPASIAIAPSRTGGNCFWLQEGHGTIGTGCAPPRFQTRAMAGGFSHGTAFTVFSAQLRPSVARVELRFQDGARAELHPVVGFVLYTIPRSHWPRGHRLIRAVAYSSTGRQLARETFDPREIGLYSCAKPAPIGAGEKACP
jgi:hypothetical protein